MSYIIYALMKTKDNLDNLTSILRISLIVLNIIQLDFYFLNKAFKQMIYYHKTYSF
jgi:hypothetical protein